MEKHSAYCAMMRLGVKVPETWLIPHRLAPDNPRWEAIAERYYREFDLEAIAERIGYPLFMKPFDGGAVGRGHADHESRGVAGANASPDLSLVSLQYYFPWAISSLVAWCIFASVTNRRVSLNQTTRAYFEVGDSDLSYSERMRAYRRLADDYFIAERFSEFSAEALPHLTETAIEYVESPEFDRLLVRVARAERAELYDVLIERARERVRLWVADQHATVA